jgi:hypothetical protein
MRRDVGAILFMAVVTAACSAGSTNPTSPSKTQSANSVSGVAPQSDNSGVEITGTVDALPPTTPAGAFTTAGRTVKTNAATVFTRDGATASFADLTIGTKVEIHGSASGDAVTAASVQIEDAVAPPNPNPNPQPEPEPHDPNPPAPNPPALNPAVPNPPSPPDNDDNEAEVEGVLGPIAGTCPSISSSVGATKFTTNASTRFDDVSCTALKAGSPVEVKGTRNADGSIAATRVKRD